MTDDEKEEVFEILRGLENSIEDIHNTLLFYMEKLLNNDEDNDNG